jgi:hypothetical protein
VRPLTTIALASVAVAALTRPAAATPAEDLERARSAFRRSEYAIAIPLLSSLLYPRPRLGRVDDLVEAHVLLAASAFETGDRATASREFDEAIYLQGDLALEPVLFSSAAVDLFDERKAAIAERNRLEADKARLAAEAEAYQKMLASLVVVEKRDYFVNFIPFGAGQFQNGDRTKGLLFATAQGVTGGISAGIWLYLVGSYGGVTGGKVPPADADRVRRLQQLEIGAGVACIGLMAWGVVDSLVHYKPSVVRKPDESALPPELRKKLAPKPKKPPPSGPTSFRLAPTPLEGGAGVAVGWEF